jgi:chemotaxis protein CheY-P-specific phosphatase CheC
MTFSKVFQEVLMRFLFMFGEGCDKDQLPLNNFDYLHARVCFNGYKRGCIGILAPVKLCIEMSSNVLGTDMEDDICTEDSVDTLEELANVVCGQFLTGAYGDSPIFSLSPPLVSETDEIAWSDIVDSDDSLAFMVEDTPTLIYLELEQEVEV